MNYIALELVLIAFVYVLVSVIAQRKFSNIKRIKEIRAEMNEKLANLKKMDKNTSKEIMDAEQKKIGELTSEMMKHQLKASVIIIPVFVIIVYVAIPYIFGSLTTDITVASFTFTYRTFFVIAAFVLGLASQAIIAAYDKMQAKKLAMLQSQSVTNNT